MSQPPHTRPPRRDLRAVLADRTGVPSMLKWALLPNGVALIAGTLISLLLGPPGAAWSFAVAVAVVGVFFALGILVLIRLLAGPAEFALAAAMGVYVAQLSLVFGVLLVLRQASWLHLNAFAAGAIGATILWQAGLVEGLRRARQPVYSPPV
ncbi:MAG: hypothetical protein IPI32_04355 [Austwickia sp.]|nr:hypothetical protein [Austwickia sp.]MBK8436861.1 hypothetical protein [Austwickia sp.]